MMERFKCKCGHDEFEPYPITARDYQEARVKCLKCGKEYGLPKVNTKSWRNEDGEENAEMPVM